MLSWPPVLRLTPQFDRGGVWAQYPTACFLISIYPVPSVARNAPRAGEGSSKSYQPRQEVTRISLSNHPTSRDKPHRAASTARGSRGRTSPHIRTPRQAVTLSKERLVSASSPTYCKLANNRHQPPMIASLPATSRNIGAMVHAKKRHTQRTPAGQMETTGDESPCNKGGALVRSNSKATEHRFEDFNPQDAKSTLTAVSTRSTSHRLSNPRPPESSRACG